MRQAVDQIDVDRLDAVGAERLHYPFGDLERLHAIDRGLHGGIEILHADADAIDAGLGERGDACLVQTARVDLDGELGVLGESEACLQCPREAQDVIPG